MATNKWYSQAEYDRVRRELGADGQIMTAETRVQFARRLKVSPSFVDKVKRYVRHPEEAAKSKSLKSTTTAIVLHAGLGHQPNPKNQDRMNQIAALQAQGFTRKEISKQLNISGPGVSYWINKMHKLNKLAKASQQGATNGHLNRHVAVGIAFAETERFIGHLAERLALPPDFLRPRLSELLGHSPFRSARRSQD